MLTAYRKHAERPHRRSLPLEGSRHCSRGAWGRGRAPVRPPGPSYPVHGPCIPRRPIAPFPLPATSDVRCVRQRRQYGRPSEECGVDHLARVDLNCSGRRARRCRRSCALTRRPSGLARDSYPSTVAMICPLLALSLNRNSRRRHRRARTCLASGASLLEMDCHVERLRDATAHLTRPPR